MKDIVFVHFSTVESGVWSESGLIFDGNSFCGLNDISKYS